MLSFHQEWALISTIHTRLDLAVGFHPGYSNEGRHKDGFSRTGQAGYFTYPGIIMSGFPLTHLNGVNNKCVFVWLNHFKYSISYTKLLHFNISPHTETWNCKLDCVMETDTQRQKYKLLGGQTNTHLPNAFTRSDSQTLWCVHLRHILATFFSDTFYFNLDVGLKVVLTQPGGICHKRREFDPRQHFAWSSFLSCVASNKQKTEPPLWRWCNFPGLWAGAFLPTMM